MENWKDVPGYEGLYKVSDLGRIRSLYNYKRDGNDILVQRVKRGYYTVGLRKNGVKSTSSIMECCKGRTPQTKGFIYKYEEVVPCQLNTIISYM